MAPPSEPAPAPPLATIGRGRMRWLSWLLGAALLGAVVFVALHFSEGLALVGLAERAAPLWLIVAFALQAITYLAEAQVLRVVAVAAGTPIPLGAAYRLALTKLFVDQALPSAGVSGIVVVAGALEQRGLPRAVVMAGLVVDSASYYAAYLLSLGVAIAITVAQNHPSTLILATSGAFLVVAIAIPTSALVLAGRTMDGPLLRRLARVPAIGHLLALLRDADPRLARDPRLIARSFVFQLAIVLLDAATVWVLLASLGEAAPVAGVFASFMISTLFRTVSVVPGGLGTFEAASVFTLKLAGVPVAVALSATLLFRGLSFWLPMLPGLYFAHRHRGPGAKADHPTVERWWSLSPDTVAARLGGTTAGLSAVEAARRLDTFGANELVEQRTHSLASVVRSQLASPLLLLLLFAAVVSALTGQWIDAVIVMLIVVISVGIGTSREYRAHQAVAALRARVHTKAMAIRDGRPSSVEARQVVPGDVVALEAGSLIPADGVLIEATDFYVNEAVLTGESFPVEKRAGVSAEGAALRERSNCVFCGTNVRSGMARVLIVATGRATQFGAIAQRLTLRAPETEFDRGIRRFGTLLTAAMGAMVIVVFAGNVILARPPIETLLFSIALAVGLSPELLPAILSVNLARGAQMMARHGVVVRRLNAIEDLGSMDILCTDKTGTLTEGVVRLEGAWDEHGAASPDVLDIAAKNAALETGLANPLDDAILQARQPDLSHTEKLGEIPYDFVRKRLSVIVREQGRPRLLIKGAFTHVLDACTRTASGALLDAAARAAIEQRFQQWSRAGTRVLAVATRELGEQPTWSRDDERELTFVGFLTFLDPAKAGVDKTLVDLRHLGVQVKLITGDVKLVAQHLASLVGMRKDAVLTGAELDLLHDEALWHAAEKTDLFVEVDPNQKERIILALKKMGHVVGFLGDGVNDAPAMHAADASLSVEDAVDVAREAADFVLLERDLDVIRHGIEEGRRTFANTLKYVLTTTSANLGNMVSMAVASLFLPFLPLTAGQVLLNNFLSDVPALGIADDSVDADLVDRPRRWDMRFIGRFMIEFGVLSSAFDLLTFATLLFVFHTDTEEFRTGWFVESLLTELVIALVVRTQRRFYQSRPGRLLLLSTVAVAALTFAIPFIPGVALLGFTPLPPLLFAAVLGITALYVLAAELLKVRFYRTAS